MWDKQPLREIPYGRKLRSEAAHNARLSSREVAKNKTQFCIGCSSVCIVVFAVALLLSVMSITPVIFLALAESSSGEMDLVLTVRSGSGFTSLNYTQAQLDLQEVNLPAAQLMTPRFVSSGVSIFKAASCYEWSANNITGYSNATYGGFAMPTTRQCQWRPGCLFTICDAYIATNFLAIDSDRERAMGIGRKWDHPAVPADEVYINHYAAKKLDVEVGDWIYLRLDAQAMFPNALDEARARVYNNPTPSWAQDVVNIPVKIGLVFDPSDTTKFSNSYEKEPMILYEFANLISLAAPHLDPLYSAAMRETLASLAPKIVDEASDILVGCGSPSWKCYQEKDFNKISKKLTAWASQIVWRLGAADVTRNLPILSSLGAYSTFSQFLGLIVSFIIILLAAVSVFLIYGLLMASVETRTFELGILRMIGTTRSGIIKLLITQAVFYAVPAWAVGLAVAQGALAVVHKLLYASNKLDTRTQLTGDAIAVATVLGLVVPLISAIFPIRAALTQNIRDSLDRRSSKIKAVAVSMDRSSPGSIAMNWSFLLAGLVCTTCGLCIYYFLPASLTASNLNSLFSMYLAILVGMLMGLVSLSFNLQPLLERLLLLIISTVLFFENQALPPIVARNLTTHKVRNRKTAIMFSFSIAFIIFLTSALSSQLNSMQVSQIQSTGADIKISTTKEDKNERPVGISLIPSIEALCEAFPDVVNTWSYMSANLDAALPNNYLDTYIQNSGRIVSYGVWTQGVSSNFLDLPPPVGQIAVTQIVRKDPVMSDVVSSVSSQLYTIKGYTSAAMSANLQAALAIQSLPNHAPNFTDAFLVSVEGATSPYATVNSTFLRPLAFLASAPIAVYSNFPRMTTTTLMLSLPTVSDLSMGLWPSIEDIPLTTMLVSLKTLSGPRHASFIAQLENLAATDIAISLDILDEKLATFETSKSLLSLVFNLATVLVLIITLFSLNSCMYTNIIEQSKELGLLRALGVTKGAIFRIYIYEAYILTLASGLLGISVGTFIAWLSSAQSGLTSELVLPFPFPWEIAIIVIAVSWASAIVSTASPVWHYVGRMTIVKILRE